DLVAHRMHDLLNPAERIRLGDAVANLSQDHGHATTTQPRKHCLHVSRAAHCHGSRRSSLLTCGRWGLSQCALKCIPSLGLTSLEGNSSLWTGSLTRLLSSPAQRRESVGPSLLHWRWKARPWSWPTSTRKTVRRPPRKSRGRVGMHALSSLM